MSVGKAGPTEPLRHLPSPERVEALAGYGIPVRRFGIGGSRRPVVLLHGLQSHSGWFVQSARHIAELGFPVHAFDRCGSGVSEGECKAGPPLSGLLTEIDAVADHALLDRGHDSFYLLGHCFGAIPALLYAGLHRPYRVAGLVLATPALYTHTDLPLRDKAGVLWSVLTRCPAQVPVPIAAEDFSELAPFVEFVRSDPLVRREFPARFLFDIQWARSRLPRAARELQAPLLAAMAGEDPICDNARTRRLLEHVGAPKDLRVYAEARHVLEFSAARDAFFQDLAVWLLQREGG